MELNEHNKNEFPPMHTAEHIINQTMVRMFGCSRSHDAHIERKKSKLNYLLPTEPTKEQIAQIETTANEIVERDLPVTYEFATKDTAPQNVVLDKLPGNVSETIRLVRIGDYDVCPCIGTHVEHTKQIGHIRISSTSYKDQVFRIVFRLDDPDVCY